MRKRYIYLFFLFLFALLPSVGCKKAYIVSEGQKILFQYDYMNYAWGYQHNGFIIDTEGNVLEYNKPEKWNSPGKDNILTQAEIEENLESCTPSGQKIPSYELRKFAKYIDNIAASKISARRRKGADSGSHIYYCFQYMESEGRYRAVVIRTEGDFESENLNFYSKRTVDWLRSIHNITKK
ncbi:MAG: hypothetical protein GYA43_09020 [Bacteroidales bacterium]|nr:hypothetical protein [Bacteroidales bacterium]